MTYSTLPRVITPKEIAEYLKVEESVVQGEFESGKLHGFKIGKEWRCIERDLLNYIQGERGVVSSQPQTIDIPLHDWDIDEIGAFDFNWPKKGGGNNLEHYDKGYEATTTINGQEYTFKIGFSMRKAAGQVRRRATIWIGNRAIVEFAGGNDHESNGLLAGIIRLKNGKQLTTAKIPEEYKRFRVERYNSIVRGPRASNGMAVIVKENDFESMLEHAVVRATWKELI
jgi:hypothetical protein